MGRIQLNKKTEGTITVFLSLILLLILSLLFTMIEGARVNTAKVFAERAVTTAMDSVLAEYYGPLWEEYHVFGYHSGGGNDKEQIQSLLSEYMSYTFDPNLELSDSNREDGIELYDIVPEHVIVSNEVNLTDYDGGLIINEAVEYMKYRELGNGLEALLNKLTLLETPGKVSYLMEEKLKVEEELVTIDRDILELMELIDGVRTSKKGIELAADGSIQIESPFIKMICYEEVTMANVGINHESIYQAQKVHYSNPSEYYDVIKESFIQLEQIQNQMILLNQNKDTNAQSLEQEQILLAALMTEGKRSDEKEEQIKKIKKRIEELHRSINEAEVQIKEQKASLLTQLTMIRDSRYQLLQLTMIIKPLVIKAISYIDRILIKIEVATPMIKQYEEQLESEKIFLEEEVYAGLEEGFKELKKYVSMDDSGYDFKGMRRILEQNKAVLDAAESYLMQAEVELSSELYQPAKMSLIKAENFLATYQIKGLTIDYSSLVLDRSGQKTPLDKVNSLLKSGLIHLVVDPEDISDAKLTTSQALPSEIAAMTQDDTDYLAGLATFFEHSVIGSNSGIGSFFGGFQGGIEVLPALGKEINQITEHILYQEYLKEHFGMYPTEEEKVEGQKPSVLTYEQEYLLVGKLSDHENLASVVSRIILLRTILDFVGILGNKQVQSEAKLIATSLVGFTGLPILISITQIMILILWAFGEALLDTCALMMGKEVPILKKDVGMQFTDLFLINRGYLMQKASQMTNSKDLALSYQDYLRLFLLMKDKNELAYKSLDLIQENIRLRYQQDSFRIENCLFGYNAEVDFMIKSKFTAIAYVRKYLNNQDNNFHFKVKATYCY